MTIPTINGLTFIKLGMLLDTEDVELEEFYSTGAEVEI